MRCPLSLEIGRLQPLPHNDLYTTYGHHYRSFKCDRRHMIFVSVLLCITIAKNPSSVATALSTSHYQPLQPFSLTNTKTCFDTALPLSNQAVSSGRMKTNMRLNTRRTPSKPFTGELNIPSHHQSLLHDLNRAQSRVRTSMSQIETTLDWNEYLLLARNMLHWINEARLIDQQPYSPLPAALVNRHDMEQKTVYIDASEIFDETVRIICDRAFSHPKTVRTGSIDDSDSWEGVRTALALLDLQTSKGSRNGLSYPYSLVYHKTWLQALRTLNLLVKRRKTSRTEVLTEQGDAAFSVLERLCTYDGVRNSLSPHSTERGSSASSAHPIRIALEERDFNHVLNNFSNEGRMDMAEQVVAIQDSTEHAPALSAVPFSILLKGYGRKQDLENVKDVYANLQSKAIHMDIVLYNSLIDAYVNCGDVERAYHTFLEVTEHEPRLEQFKRPLPNVRTFNTMLKGFARTGDVEKQWS